MNKTDYIKLFKEVIEKAEPGLSFDIDVSYFDDSSGPLYCDLDYQIDDRDESRGNDDDVADKMKKILSKKLPSLEFGVYVQRMDAFPNGYAAYTVTISKE